MNPVFLAPCKHLKLVIALKEFIHYEVLIAIECSSVVEALLQSVVFRT